MANLTQHLISISPDLRSGPSPGRRLLALVLCAMLAIGSTFPGIALASEADSEGVGTAPPVELPGPPELEPGGEETTLEEVPAAVGGEEGGAVETEAEVVTGAATEVPVEAAPPPPVASPEPAISAPESEQQKAPESSEPVANQSIVAPKQKQVHSTASESATSSEALPPEPAQQEASSPQPVASTSPDPARSLAGKDIYVVRPGDCLWHIAASLLPDDADTQAIVSEVARLWRLNEDRIGTGDPNLIYARTELRLH